MEELEELKKTVEFVQRRRALLLRQLEELDEITPRLLKLMSLLRDPSFVEEPGRADHAPLSVFNKVVKLLEEAPRVLTADEIMEEWKRRGDPIQGTNPKAALRTALSEAVKKSRLTRVAEGVYMASKYPLAEFPSLEPGWELPEVESEGWSAGLKFLGSS